MCFLKNNKKVSPVTLCVLIARVASIDPVAHDMLP
jgi:hypothetical protein